MTSKMIMMLRFLCLFLLLLVLIKVFYKLWWTPFRIQNLMILQGIKGPPYRLLYGNAKEIINMQKEAMSRPISLSHDIFSRVQPHIHSWTKSYGKNFLQWFGLQPVLVVTEPDLCKEILNNKDGVYPKPTPSVFVKKLFGDSLSMTEGKKWAKLRKLSNLAFHGESLKAMFPEMIASAEAMVERWKNHEGKEIDVFEEFRLLTSEVISRTAFGSSYLEGQNIFEMLMKLSVIVFRNLFKIRFPGMSKVFRTSDEIEADKLEKGIRASIMEIVKKREEKVTSREEESFGSDFLGLLLKAHHDTNDNQRISIDDLVEECKSLYFVGQETTNTLLSWTVFLLAQHPAWQEEARKEVLQLFGKQTPNSDGISKLKTMSMIINETLRLYPPANFLGREVARGVRLGKILVPANIELVIPTLALHHDPQLWGQDVALFKPERFSEGVAKATNDNMASFLPFGMGPRTCVGFNFASNEAKIALSMILQCYSFTLSPGYVHSPFQFLTLRPQYGVQVILHSL
ncbi:putative cytochrome P450, EF-Hand 1, calcium-binding protein [Rosa chinensis]|uniref:Putative cytochrome P450, EF-Hand 1, calcium-binding protein n=1 Tax=Rosa chinensis TaxID=74649 RepID=A0A2P6QY14_ROSCH|nr:cytochrome P450 CYP749A22 [Rosa chinensis]PRQ39036.1 putative cytochrome P450, EF-Hand 1, calcium-binding protein [Rosa chinensis]